MQTAQGLLWPGKAQDSVALERFKKKKKKKTWREQQPTPQPATINPDLTFSLATHPGG
jgi:hypothetical protein